MYVMLSNKNDPDYGEVTIPLPIPEEEYAKCMEMLSAMEIGSATEQDCKVEELHTGCKTLERLVGTLVNVDELDYLAKRLESFCVGEDSQYEAMAHLLDLHDIKDFINLTFCCQQATVITDFSDLEKIGREHYMNTHGGAAPVAVLEQLDAKQIVRDLIAGGTGRLTPYGVVFDNGMELAPLYEGGEFPGYHYTPKVLDAELYAVRSEICRGFLQLPMPNEQLDRMLLRGGFVEGDEFTIKVSPEQCPKEVMDHLNEANPNYADGDVLRDLNRMCRAIMKLSEAEREKLGAVVLFVKPEHPFQFQYLAEHLDDFEFAPGVKTNEDYGRYMIQQSEQFEYDPDLEPYYDYRKYGDDHLAWREGQFNEYGYVSYQGPLSMDELRMEGAPEQEQGMEFGGLT